MLSIRKITEKYEKAHHRIQKGMYFSDFIETPNYKLCYSDTVLINDWNYVTFVNPLKSNIPLIINKIVTEFHNINREPTIYLTPSSSQEVEQHLLCNDKWKIKFIDSWLIFNQKKINKGNLDLDFVLVKNDSPTNIEMFINCFINCYGGPVSKDNPYGGLPGYFFTAFRNSFKNISMEKMFNLIGFFNNKCVGIGTIIVYKDYAGIYNMGTIPEMRNKGVCRAITYELIRYAKKRKVKNIFLLTEIDGGPEKVYTNLGFKRTFIGKGYIKNELGV
jgi:ribosomal protein S18 acetylase RimI-like enzyme